MAIPLTDEQVQNLNIIGDKISNLSGLSNGFGNKLGTVLSSLSPAIGSMSLYVDGTIGADNGDGSLLKPFKTIQAAIDSVSSVSNFNITINVKRGTYNEALNINKQIGNPQAPTSATKFLLQGIDWDPVVPATGVQTGTVASVDTTAMTVTVTGAGWTINDLKGTFMHVLTGGSPWTGQYIPIVSNTATALEIPRLPTILNGCTFEIVKHAVFLQKPAGKSGVIVTGLGAWDAQFAFFGITIAGFRMQGAAPFELFVSVQQGNCDILNCYLDQGQGSGINIYGGNVAISSTWITSAAGTSTNANGIFVSDCNTLMLRSAVIDAPSLTSAGISVRGTLKRIVTGAQEHTVIQGWGTGLNLGGANGCTIHSYSGNPGRFILRNNSVAAANFGPGTYLTGPGLTVSANPNFGIIVTTGCNLLPGSTTIDGSTFGITYQGPANLINLAFGGSITNCITVGVQMASLPYSCHNTFTCASSFTFTSNGADFFIDSSTATTIATIRAATRKTVLDGATPTYYNIAMSA